MHKRRSIGYTCIYQSFKHIQFTPVELEAELVEIALQEICLNIVVNVKQQTLRVPDCDVNPRQDFGYVLRFDDLRHMRIDEVLEVDVTLRVVCHDVSVAVNPLHDLCVKRWRLQVVKHEHLNVSDSFRYGSFVVVRLNALGDDKHFRLALGTATAFQLLV